MTKVERICLAALDRPVEERAAFLDDACHGDEALRHEIESLLAYAAPAEQFIEQPAVAWAAALAGLSGLSLGQRLGPYRIVARLGAGGMGEVYRAHDTQLGREVAIKILPVVFAADPERLARFEREARVLASLNHPHIATIYGLERFNGQTALVMELVEGLTLAHRIAEGPIPVDEALAIAKQIAEALEGAHERGIVHRDLKPANIKVRPDGTVKVLDFGLAKAIESVNDKTPAAGGVPPSLFPVVTPPAMTQAGLLLGTAAYMSPEQARGKTVDKRTDIWAFGCVLFEMLTARLPFAGEDVTETLGRIMATEPDWDELPAGLSPVLTTYLRRCLEKNVKQRVADAQDIRLALEGAFEATMTQREEVTVPPSSATRRRGLVLALASFATAVVVAVAAWALWPSAEPSLVNRFDVALAAGQGFRNAGRPVMALSPDGRRFVYNAGGGLYLRTMGELAARLIPGTEAVLSNPAFSPDGQSLAYFQGTQLKRISISGGTSLVICSATNPFGVSWESDDTILFAQPEGIMRVSASGGMPELVIQAEEGDQMHGPQRLPDGETVLFSVTRAAGETRWDKADIVVQSLRTGERTVLLQGGSDARYVSTGHLVYALENSLFAVAFDLTRLQVRGAPISVVEGVMRARVPQTGTGTANFGISRQGTLVYAPGEAGLQLRRRLVWVSRTGQEEAIPADVRAYVYPRLSPDGARVALEIRDQEDDIWIFDLARRNLMRLTFDPTRDTDPVWSPEGKRLVFSSARSGRPNLYWQAADGTGTLARLTDSNNPQFPQAMTPDGTEILFQEAVSAVQNDLLRLLLASSHRPHSAGGSEPATPLVQTMFDERNAVLAPNGKWLAYESNAESGRYEIYVRPFPDVASGSRWQVSTSGGRTPLWAPNSEELFYVARDGTIQGVRVEGSTPWRNSTPAKVLDGDFVRPNEVDPGRVFDIAPDGQRFLMIKAVGSDVQVPQSLVVVQNWIEELKRLVPAN